MVYEKRSLPMSKMRDQISNAMTIALKVVINCEPLGLEKNFQGTCFGHAFSKACQYGIVEEKVCKDLKYVSIKVY